PVTPANLYAGSRVIRSFVAKFSATGATGGTNGYVTYLGGLSEEVSGGVAVDGLGNAYVTGGTSSRTFPTTTGAFQPVFPSFFSAYVTKLNPTGTPVYSTFLDGTSGFSEGLAIAVDSAGDAYVTGFTNSTNFPTLNPFQATNHGENAFVTKLNPAG